MLRLGARPGGLGEQIAQGSRTEPEIHGRFWPVEKGPGLLDTGPLVSFLAAGLRHHSWACEQWKYFRPPLLTCEPVPTEAAFLLSREGHEVDPLFALLDRGVIRIALNVQEEQADLRALMHRYRNRPISLADACVVRLSE